MTNTSFEKLLSPSCIGSVKTRNRFIKSAAGLQYWAQGDHPVTDRAKYLYEAFARGGVGLIIMDATGCAMAGANAPANGVVMANAVMTRTWVEDWKQLMKKGKDLLRA
jgi:2,4-dienoyl-CoA reductase-like NADH-dependent reductase (Old Yellow Enzyme family)